jgi:hypothetical protein
MDIGRILPVRPERPPAIGLAADDRPDGLHRRPARESDPPLVELTVPAAGICNGAPCWKATPRGFRFKDAAAAEDGVTVVRLASGADGGRINVKAKNVRGVPDLPAPLRVRLVRHDAPGCFEADLAPVPGAALRFQSR